MPETVTDIIIDASVDRVWQVLSDFPAYPAWNPYIRRMAGSLESGGSLHVTRLLPGRGEVASTPAITLYRPGREIRLLDRPVLPGLLDVEHGLKLEPLGTEQVRFVHWQTTSGLLAPIFGGVRRRAARPARRDEPRPQGHGRARTARLLNAGGRPDAGPRVEPRRVGAGNASSRPDRCARPSNAGVAGSSRVGWPNRVQSAFRRRLSRSGSPSGG